MRLLLYVNSNAQSGLGHFTRCLALARQTHEMGHTVGFVGDCNPHLGIYPHYLALDTKTFHRAVKAFKPDWTIVDLPGNLPDKPKTGRLCVIDGLGYENGVKPDLAISQGFQGEFCAPNYLILRRELARYKNTPRGFSWLVYGGAADELGLLPAFNRAMADKPANLLVTEYMRNVVLDLASRHNVVQGRGDASLGWLATAGKSCVHLGMSVWELAYYGVPIWIISRTERHLETAFEFDKRGYALAWHEVGLPGDNELREWLGWANEPTGQEFDLEGSRRVVELMERG